MLQTVRGGFASFAMALTCTLLLVAGPARADEDAYTGDADEAQELFDEAEALREERKFGDAATKYWEAVEADLRHYRAHVRYQETAIEAGDPLEDLVEDYGSFIDDYPNVFVLHLHKARLMSDTAARVTALEALKAQGKEAYNVALEIGRARLAGGDAAGAIEPLTAAAALCPATRTDVVLMLAQAEFEGGKPAEARARLEAAVTSNPEFFGAQIALARMNLEEERYPDAVERADIVLKLRVRHIGAFLIKAEAQYRQEDVAESLVTLVAARRVSPDDQDVKLAYADVLGREEEGQSAAIKLYGEVVDADEENLHALFGWGWVLERQEKFEEAEEKYREVVAIEPDSVVAINSVGYCMFQQGRVSDAQVQFKKAADIDPDYGSARLNLGATYDAQAKYNDAIKIYENFLKDNPKNLRALINCAFDHESLGAFPKALKLLEAAHDIYPNDSLIVAWIADNNYFQKNWKKAEKWYKKAVEMDEKSFFAWRGLGYTLGHMKRWEDSVKALEKAKAIDGDDLDVYLALGDVYMAEIEDLESALKNFQEYVQRGGNDPAIQDLIVEIQKQLEK